ncbi:hypothetical protein CHS0354_018146 [Potamilus streckersoni]|uniref:Uncharacterized protein n=1 Tax=Potamilus streckersoni TaxID=2493646 RepID=A0AAE0STB8_9BIVA|nr:hypothetical protein CHS0354_018146 [Potamilus streckersoni]
MNSSTNRIRLNYHNYPNQTWPFRQFFPREEEKIKPKNAKDVAIIPQDENVEHVATRVKETTMEDVYIKAKYDHIARELITQNHGSPSSHLGSEHHKINQSKKNVPYYKAKSLIINTSHIPDKGAFRAFFEGIEEGIAVLRKHRKL